MNGEQDSASLDSSFVAFGFVLWNAHAYKSAEKATDGSTNSESCECGHDGTSGDEWTDARDSKSADAREEAEGSANDASGGGACSGSFGSLGALLVGEGAGGFVIGE